MNTGNNKMFKANSQIIDWNIQFSVMDFLFLAVLKKENKFLKR